MSYYMRNRMGTSVGAPDAAQMRQVLAELEDADDEHPDVSLRHESGWVVSVFADRTLYFENIEDPSIAPRQGVAESWDEVIDLLQKVAHGDLEDVSAWHWH